MVITRGNKWQLPEDIFELKILHLKLSLFSMLEGGIITTRSIEKTIYPWNP